MNAHLNHIVGQERIADLRRDAERARLVSGTVRASTPTRERKRVAWLVVRLVSARV